MNTSKGLPRIGVLDSGVGGLTVVRELERLMPCESIVYFGDNANCPYGNRDQEDILRLTLDMLDCLRDQNVKIAAIACNTISTLIDRYRDKYEFPIVSIIDAACGYAASQGLERVGVFATEFTIRQGAYEKVMRRLNPNALVYGRSSRVLAELVDKGRLDDPALTEEVKRLLDALLSADPVDHIILGCTHYPIVQDIFQREAPGVTFINPALEQAKAVRALLEEHGMTADDSYPSLDIFTSGEGALYDAMLKRLEIGRLAEIHITRAKGDRT